MHQVSEQGREREREMGDEREEEETGEGEQSRLTDGLANMEYFSS